MTSPEPFVHQIVFRYTYDAKGLQITASSLEANHEQGWYKALRDRLRLQEAESGETPENALSYLVFDKTSVVLWRFRTGETKGRNSSRALVGITGQLTPAMAIGLTSWPGWNDELPTERVIEPVPWSHLTPYREVHRDYEQMVQHEAYRHTVTEVLARMLDEPGRPVSVIGFDQSAPPFVWALMEAGDKALRARHVLSKWTFSTWETRHDNGLRGLPEIVFLPEPQRNPPASIDRVQVNVEAEASASEASYQYADALFRHRFLGEPLPAAPDPVQTRAGSPLEPSTKLPQLDHYGRQDSLGGQVGNSPTKSPDRLEPVMAVVSGSPEMPPATGGSQTAPGVDWLGGGPANGGTRLGNGDSHPGNGGARSVASKDLTSPPEEVVTKLVQAGSVAEYQKAIAAAKVYGTTSGLRKTVRKALMDRSGLERVAAFVDEKAASELVDDLVNALFGDGAIDIREKGPDARSDAADMISQSQSSLIAQKLVEVGIEAEGTVGAGPMMRAAMSRLVAEGEPPAAGPIRRLVSERTKRLRTQRTYGFIFAALAFVILVTVFVAAYSLSAITSQLQTIDGNTKPSEPTSPAGGGNSGDPAKKDVAMLFPWKGTLPGPALASFYVYVTDKDGKQYAALCQLGEKNNAVQGTSVVCPQPEGTTDPKSASIGYYPEKVAGAEKGVVEKFVKVIGFGE